MAQHEKRLAAIHGTLGRHATHIPMTTNNLMASSTFIPPELGIAACALRESEEGRGELRRTFSNLQETREIFFS